MTFDTYWNNALERRLSREFDDEFQALEEALQDELLAHAKLLQSYRSDLARPTVDTLRGPSTPT